MTFKLRNPWIDPRVELVRPKDAQAYLQQRGWTFKSRSIQGMLTYHSTSSQIAHNDASATAIVPEEVAEAASFERMIELVATIASYEKRFAGDVLNDLLRTSNAPVMNLN